MPLSPGNGTISRVTIWGKIVGAFAGYALGGLLGAIIGLALGHIFDRYRGLDWRNQLGHARDSRERRRARRSHAPPRSDPRRFADPAETQRIAFATAVIVLGAKLSKVDGVVTHEEIRAFKRVFRIDEADVGDVARIYNNAKTSPRGFEPYARQIGTLFGHDRVLLEELLAGLFELARSDGELNPAEVDFLRRVAAILGFTTTEFEQVRARFTATARSMEGADDAYVVLGLKRGASDDEVKSAYRKLVREHHPDTLVAKGLPPEMVERANDTLASINAAYDRIAKERNLR